MTLTAIRARGVTKSYARRGRKVTAIDHLDVTVTAGEVVAISGPTLSGKTTLLNLLAGWLQPDGGTVEWPGATAAPPTWRELTVIPQSLMLLDELTVGENIGLPLRASSERSEADGWLTELLETLDIDRLRHRSPDEISVGESQRVTVARALVTRPHMILADEPVAHQDEQHAEIILELLRGAAITGAGCVIAARNPEVAAVAGRAIELRPSRRQGGGVRVENE